MGRTSNGDWKRRAGPVGLFGNDCWGAGGKEPLAKLRKQVEELTQDTVPVVRADWFVTALTGPPLAGPMGLLRTPANDLPEAEAIVKVFGLPGPAVTSIKGITGHSLAAAGSLEAAALWPATSSR